MDLIVSPTKDRWTATWNAESLRCAVGRSGIVEAEAKQEGDGASPAGAWPMRRLLYRADRLAPPRSGLPSEPIAENDGWCDAPDDARYNQPVKLPYEASHERLWREDGLYDLVVVLGHNDAPVRPGLGSAIFLHCAQPDFSPTEGCIAMEKASLLSLLASAGPGDRVVIESASAL